ncbi:MAG: hypothetical protein ABFD59_08240 [Smithella sp.]
MNRYFMSASNGGVVPHESPNGGWIEYNTFEEKLAEQRRKLGAAHDETLKELDRVRTAAKDEIAALQSQLAAKSDDVAWKTVEAYKKQLAERESELKDGDSWMERAKAFTENGGCPWCFATDEEGHKAGCHILEVEQDNVRMREGLEEKERRIKRYTDSIDNTEAALGISGLYAKLEEYAENNEKDVQRLDWLENMMSPDNNYCEIYMAGLRNFKTGKAEGFQVESCPDKFPVSTGRSLREAIDAAEQALNPPGREGD